MTRHTGRNSRKSTYVIAGAVTLALAGLVGAQMLTPRDARGVEVTVYTTPTCGCCTQWAEHMREAGFQVNVEYRENLTPVKAQYGVQGMLQTCHTAIVDGYVVEGHVPADAVRQLLEDRLSVTGIVVPGMPIGSPGMEQGGQRDPFNVLTFDRDGRTAVYARF